MDQEKIDKFNEVMVAMENLEEVTVVYLDKDMEVLWVKDSSGREGGKPFLNEYPGEKCFQMWRGANSPCSGCPVPLALSKGELQRGEIKLPGGSCWYITTSPVRDNGGNIIGVVKVGLDITGLKKVEEDLRQSQLQLKAILQSTADGILAVDVEGRVLAVNDRLLEMWKISERITDKGKDLFKEKLVLDQLKEPQDFLNNASLHHNGFQEGYDILHFKDGRIYEHYSRPLLQGSLIKGRVWSFRDITQEKKAEEEIHYLCFHDRLTGLYNRTYLEEEMRRMDTERQLPISIIMGDLNGLKLVNDIYGHVAGDKMLVFAAEILKDSCRMDDIVTRWGGDEFLIFLPRTSFEKVQGICKRIEERFEGAYIKDVPLSMALGFASKVLPEENLYEILNEAESRMYEEKIKESRNVRRRLLKALLNTLRGKSWETNEHSNRIQEMSCMMGEKLSLPQAEMERLNLLSLLHDIGKINISKEILMKKGKLNEKEWETVKKHPETGYRIACSMEEFAHIAEDILCHHEHWDGKGYPQGLKGGGIPLLARIIALVDAYDVMVSGRPYQDPLSHSEAVAEIKRKSGTQFDPDLVNILISLLESQRVASKKEKD